MLNIIQRQCSNYSYMDIPTDGRVAANWNEQYTRPDESVRTGHNLSFIWLMGGLVPDYKTISEFRRKNKKSLKGVLKKCVRMCIELDLIEGNVLFVDGTKIRANASRGKNYTQKQYEYRLSGIDENIYDSVDLLPIST